MIGLDYSQLNQYVPPVASGLSDAWRRVLSRLGDDTSLVVRALNLRPEAVALHGQTDQHLLVRITTAGSHLILRAAPEDDLAAYSFFVRSLAGQRLPGPQLIQRDLTRTMVPFAYVLESYTAGVSACQLGDAALLRGAGRQAGRALRRMHRVPVLGTGRPTANGRWPTRGWLKTLRAIGQALAPPPTDALLFDDAERAALAAALADPVLRCEQPVLIHGAFGPAAVRCTAGAGVHLEAIVEPGPWVGGDGLFDLARGLDPAHPLAWREGLLEGYCAAGPLSPAEQARLPLLQLLAWAWGACYRYMRAEPHAASLEAARELLLGRRAASGPLRAGAQSAESRGPST